MFPTLAKIAHRVFAIPASSAAAERSWSTDDYIHSMKSTQFGDCADAIEAFEDELGVGDLVEDEAAVTEELEFDLEHAVNDRHCPRAGRSGGADSNTSSTASSVSTTNELQLVR
ncbi:hAT family C-terminal dimerization region [Phytophthora infestans]|uniref:HAT family C-terminal dimerization region n=1 Tax=Phytophthora infestans TaxID=4787 RepID=A0A8S9UVA2_PHYIN|nr:hAT family C-terminal dimerization region [Phytophthora infestans]